MKIRRTIAATASGFAVAVLVPAIAFAATVNVYSSDTTWHDDDQRGAGSSAITTTQPDKQGGNASLEQKTTGNNDKTTFRHIENYGPLSDITALSFDWYRDAGSTAAAHLTPAFGLYVADSDGNSWLLKWEGVYNGYTVNGTAAPTNQWVTTNLMDGNYWRIPQTVKGNWVGFDGCSESGDPYGCFNYTRKLTDSWLNGFDVAGVEVGLGSGWDGTYHSFADNITVDNTTYNFAVPKPSKPSNKEDCKNNNWKDGFLTQFKNQGDCVSSVVSHGGNQLTVGERLRNLFIQ